MTMIKPIVDRRGDRPKFVPTEKKPGEFMLVYGKLVEVKG